MCSSLPSKCSILLYIFPWPLYKVERQCCICHWFHCRSFMNYMEMFLWTWKCWLSFCKRRATCTRWISKASKPGGSSTLPNDWLGLGSNFALKFRSSIILSIHFTLRPIPLRTLPCWRCMVHLTGPQKNKNHIFFSNDPYNIITRIPHGLEHQPTTLDPLCWFKTLY